MSTGTKIGSILGAVAGAALGFLLPGAPALMSKAGLSLLFKGALLGFTIGGGIGSYLDPITVDVDGLGGVEDLQELDYPTADEGTLIPDFVGVTKLTGNFLWYANNRSEEVTESDSSGFEGGKGGGEVSADVTTSHIEYYLTWIMGIAVGPVDEVLAIYRDQECVWSGSVTRSDGNPASITVDGIGQIYFYFGTGDQAASNIVAQYLDDSTLNPAYRHLCYALFNDCYIGDYNRVPLFYFVVRKHPDVTNMGREDKKIIEDVEINPAHALYHALSSEHLCAIPEQFLDVAKFQEVADTLYDENFGIGITYDKYTSGTSYVEAILVHIDGTLMWTAEGKLAPRLIRKDVNIEDMETVTLSQLQELPSIKRRSWLDTVNEVKVQYTERIQTNCDEG